MSRVPRIRFKGFEEDWEQRKFVELFLEKRDKTQSEDEDVLLSCAITGIYLNSELFSHFRGTSNIGYLKIKKNDLILSAQNLHLGNANVNLLFEHGIISPAYKVYELNECDQYFVQSWVKKDSTKDFFLNATTEGASQCRKNIDWCILNNQLIVIPSLYEQVRIGKLFNSLNHLITLHQRKLEKLKIIKKSMLENLFPQNGEKTPKIRFSGFTKDWEQRKLEYYLEVSEERNLSNDYTKENVLSVSGDVGIVNQIEFQGRSFAGILVNNYGVVKTGYVVYTKSPLKNNPYGIIKANKGRDGIVSTLYAIYKPKLNVNSNFIQIYFEQNARMNNYMQPLVNKGAKNDMKISSGNALKGNVVFPIRKEQDIIVDFFFKIDHLITLHQSKLDKLQKIKKSMLESMFV